VNAELKPATKAGIGSPRSSAQLSTGILQRKCACGRSAGLSGDCEECQGNRVQRKSNNSTEPAEVPPIVYEVLRSPGQPLDVATRAFLEPRLGYDFSHVRVHTDAKAAESARAVNALAYTVGNNLVFGLGQYVPGIKTGKRLIAHELTHVVQQRGRQNVGLSSVEIQPHEHASEKAAVSATDRVDEQGPAIQVVDHPVQLMRQPGGTPGALKSVGNVVSYDRSQFGDRFDAEVNKLAHRVTLIMSVDFTPAGWPALENPAAKLKEFKSRLKEVIERIWSSRYGLQSICHGGEDSFQARVILLTDGANPHATVYFHPDTPGGRSSAGDGQSALQESDVFEKEHSRYFQTQKGKPPEQRSFVQLAAAHEFGHLLGLSHPHCKGNETQCYGVTTEEAMDVMGLGSHISPKDYAPFQRIMERYGQDNLPPPCNKWKLVDPR
jgi:Domain of unknown function (DUF4157)